MSYGLQSIRIVLGVVKILVIAILCVVIGKILLYFSIKPIVPNYSSSNQNYYTDILGTVFFGEYRGCLDICLTKNYSKFLVDKETFKVLLIKNPYSRNGELIESNYAKDKQTVYFKDRIVPQANPDSFQAIDTNFGFDGIHYYLLRDELTEYLHDNINPSIQLNYANLQVLSYKTDRYIVIKQGTRYYLAKLNPLPQEIYEISFAETQKYPALK